MFIPEADELRPPHDIGDHFAAVDEPEPGFGNRFCDVVVDIAGQGEALTDRKPLEPSHLWSPEEMAEAHHALTAIDVNAFCAASVRYRHLGIPIVLVTASIGVPGTGASRRYEERIEGWPELIIECHYRALPIMQSAMRRLLVDVANRKLAEVLADLERRAGRQ